VKTATFYSLLLTTYSLLFCAAAGCSSNKSATTRPASTYDRQQAALKDPFGYSPNMEKPEDITGGNINQYDKNGMRKDLDHVLNP